MNLLKGSLLDQLQIDSSYSKGGKSASFTDEISKQTVKDLVHRTVVEMPTKEVETKKRVKYFHIVADEDHVAAQFQEEKGDLPRDIRGYKINTIMPKLICLYEGNSFLSLYTMLKK